MARILAAHLLPLVASALEQGGASSQMAESTARALVAAEEEGLPSHGLSRLPQYLGHLRTGRVDGRAVPSVRREGLATALVDAADGLAFPACDLAIERGIALARAAGVAWVGVTNSHHFGVASWHLRPLAAAGLVGLAFSNSPAAMPAWGGKRPLFGTNPIAALFPRRQQPPLIIDLSLSEVARGKLMIAAREGRPIPLGWALDREGQPTTDPQAGLDGMMLPAGGVKGAMLALLVELLCCALTGAHFGFEADSFFQDQGNRPRIGQAFLLLSPSSLAGEEVFAERLETLLSVMLLDPEVRLPGLRRHEASAQAAVDGIALPPALLTLLAPDPSLLLPA
ncbi:MAG: Ldh family oxidoreductase [Blastocatellia bacterium]